MSKHQTPSTSHVIATPLQSNNANHQSTPLRLEPSEPSRPTSGLHLSLPSTSGACSSEPSTSTANGSSTTEAVSIDTIVSINLSLQFHHLITQNINLNSMVKMGLVNNTTSWNLNNNGKS